MLLSVLICTLNEREETFNYIHERLLGLIKAGGFENEVEILVEKDNRENTTGYKRNLLKDRANGDFVCYIDDDDDVTDDYFIELINAIKHTNADVISFLLDCFQGGAFSYRCGFFKHIHRDLGDIHVMPPTHLCPHRKELANRISFPNTSWQEDYYYMIDLDKITREEHHIDKVLYLYRYNPNK